MQKSKEQWQRLVAEMGLSDATRRIMAENTGLGDSVKELGIIWGDLSVFEIYQTILAEIRPASDSYLDDEEYIKTFPWTADYVPPEEVIPSFGQEGIRV